MAWPSIYQIKTADPVSASVVMSPIQALTDRSEHLLSLLNELGPGRAIISNHPADASVELFDPVYLDDAGVAQRAQYSVDVYGQPVTSSTGLGIAIARSGDTVDVASAGFLPDTLLSDTSGPLYVSAIAGLVSSTPGGGLLGHQTPEGFFVLLGPASRREHTHALYRLVGSPAAAQGDITDPLVGDPHVIDQLSIDDQLEGWVPVGHSLLGNAPAGAAFGYYSPDSVVLASLRLPSQVGYLAILDGLALDQDQLVVDSEGVWWMDDAYGQVPWATDYSVSGDSSETRLYFASITTDTNQFVTRLTAGSGVNITDEQGNMASSGRLVLEADRTFTDSSVDDLSETAVKSLGDGLASKGPVVVGIAGGTGIQVSGTANSAAGSHGLVTLSLTSTTLARHLLPSLQRYDGARSDLFNDLPYSALPAGRASSVTFQFDLPGIGSSGAVLQLQLLGLGDATLPALTIEYKLVRAAAAVPSAWTTLATLNESVVSGNVEKFDTAILATLGSQDTLLVRVSRAADAYAAAVGLVKAVVAL